MLKMNATDQLHRAIHAGLLKEVKRLVKEGANMDCVLGMRGTALCAAIEARNLEITEFLISSGCDVNAQDFDGEPPLLLALRKDNSGQTLGRKPSLDIAKVLIENRKCNVNKYDPLTKKSALHFATEQGMEQVVEWLMGSPEECNFNAADSNGDSALHLAIQNGHPKVVKVLISNPKCLLKIYNKAGLTPLHICASKGDVECLDILFSRLFGSSKDDFLSELETGFIIDSELSINVNAETMFEKETCLHIASRSGHVDIVRTLLKSSAKVDTLNNIGNTALLLSLGTVNQWQTMSNEIPKLLLKKGANPNIRATLRCRYIKPDCTVTPLIVAAKNNNVALARMLIEHGADINLTDTFGQTPLFVALWENALHVAHFFLDECPGINVNILTEDGSTCLHAVLKYCSPVHNKEQSDIVKRLINIGGNLLPDKQGITPIDSAYEHENHDALDALLESTQTNADGLMYKGRWGDENPEMLFEAVGEGCIDIVKVLLAHGADIDLRPKCSGGRKSLLEIALINSEYRIAEFLVENGCDLCKEEYIFKELDKKKRDSFSQSEQGQTDFHEETDSDDLESDCVSEDSEDFDDIFHGHETFKKWLREVASAPRNLQLLCLVNIRKYFRDISVPLHKVDYLPLPEKLRNKCRYR